MSKKKVLFVATVVKGHINVFHLPFLKLFKEQGYETHVCAKNDFEDGVCVIPYCDVYHDNSFERNPLQFNNINAYKTLRMIIDNNDFDIIHCHTPVAGVLTRIAAKKARKNGTKVMYTAHGFHFYKGGPLLNWLLYFPIEYFCSFMTDSLITINNEDFKIAKKYFKSSSIELIPGVGVDIARVRGLKVNKKDYFDELGIPMQSKVLLSVGELSDRKNHKLIIDTIYKMNDKKLIYIICGRGEKLSELKTLVNRYGLEQQIIFAGFRKDVLNFYHIADLFVFPSKQEGLPVALMEALASGIPCIASNIRGNSDLLLNNKEYLFDIRIIEDVEKLICNNISKTRFTESNLDRYDLKNIMRLFRKIYGLETKED